MTARLAAHRQVAARAGDVLHHMIIRGVDVELAAPGGVLADGSDSLEAVRDGTVELALVGLHALRGAAADGLAMLAVFAREDPRDALVVTEGAPRPLRELPVGARVGVAGGRRRGFLSAHRPDLEAVLLDDAGPGSGLDLEGVDAFVTTSWEARRAGRVGRVGELLDPRSWPPEPGEGAVALMARHPIAEVTALDHLPTRTALRAELALLDALGAPGRAPLGCLAQPSGRLLRVWAAAASGNGARVVRADLTGPLDEPELLGASVARELERRGAVLVLEDALA